MKAIKSVLALLLASSLVFSAISCGTSDDDDSSSTKSKSDTGSGSSGSGTQGSQSGGTASIGTVAGTYTINGVTYVLVYDGNVTSGGEKVGTFTVANNGTVTISIEAAGSKETYTASTDSNGALNLSSVKDSEGKEAYVSRSYTLAFNVLGLATKISSTLVKSTDDPLTEEKLTAMVKGVVDGYVFKGWYLDFGYTQPVTYPFKVASSMTIYAKFAKVSGEDAATETDVTTYTIRYISDKRSRTDAVIADTTLMPSDNLSALESQGYLFTGWFYDSAFTAEAYAGSDFSVYADSTNTVKLYAKWIEISEVLQNLSTKANFEGLTFEDLKDVTLYARTGKTDAATFYEKISTLDELQEKGYNDSQKNRAYLSGGAKMINNALVYGSTTEKLVFYYGSSRKSYYLGFNGAALSVLPEEGKSVSLKNMNAFVAVNAPKKGTVVATFGNWYSTTLSESNATAGFIDVEGKVLKTHKVDNSASAGSKSYILTYDVTEPGPILFSFGRNGDAGGGVRLASIKFYEEGATAVNLYVPNFETLAFVDSTKYDIGGFSIDEKSLIKGLYGKYEDEINAYIQKCEDANPNAVVSFKGFSLFNADPTELFTDYERIIESGTRSDFDAWVAKFNSSRFDGDIDGGCSVYACPEFTIEVTNSELSLRTEGAFSNVGTGMSFSVDGINVYSEYTENVTVTSTLPYRADSASAAPATSEVKSLATYTANDSANTVLEIGKPVTLEPGDYEVTVSYTYNGLTATAKLSLTVNEVEEYNFDFKKLGSYDDTTPVLYKTETSIDDVVYLYNETDKRMRIRPETNNINYNGSNASWTSAEKGYWLATPDCYVCVDVSKLPAVGNVEVSFGYKVNSSTNATGDNGLIAIVDESGYVISSVSGLKLKTGNDSGTISATIPKTGKALLYFSRGGESGGGIDVTSITATYDK